MSARRAVREIYRDLDDGFSISRAEVASVRASRGDPTYGELTPAGVDRMIEALDPGPRDVFYDLGSGIGKVVVQVAMIRPIARCVGVELSRSRCRIARSAVLRARKRGLVQATRCAFHHADLLESPLSGATIVYTCSTAFTLRFMRLIARRLVQAVCGPFRFVTLQELSDPPKRFLSRPDVRVATNWNRSARAYVYDVTGR